MWLRQGNVEYVRGNFETAEAYYRRALAARPDLAEAHHNLHYVYLAQAGLQAAAGRDDEAASLLEQALEAYGRAVELKPFLALLPARYRVEGVLGQGGIGVVYRARDTETGDVVAVKLLNRAHMYSEKAAQRFRREALLLKRLHDSHIVRLLDAGQYEGRQFLVLEYLGRQSLDRLLRQQGRLSLDQAHRITRQVGHALEVAHGQGIIHRDLKPSNIFVVGDEVKVIDFGLAADLEAGQPSVLGIATGTIRYMSPEQQRGAPVDERTDLYALATVFYEMLTGRHPDEGTYEPLSELVDGVDPALDVVVERARQPLPEERYPDLHTFLAELEGVVPTQPASRRSAPWRRLLAGVQAGIARATGDYWFLTLGVGLFAGFLLPYLLPVGGARVASRFLGVAVWDVFFLVLLARWYTLTLARRRGHATLAAYGPLLGTFLGLSTAAIVWSTLRLDVDWGGQIDWVEFAVAHILHGFIGLVVGGLGYLSLASCDRLAARRGWSSRVGLLLGLAIICLLLVALFVALSIIGWGAV
jgi:serine/threonine-protein kinase